MNINLHIERLILDGLPVTRGQSPLVQAVVETELSRLLSERGLASSLQSGGAMPSVRGGGIQLAAKSNPSQIGQQIAQAVYSGIGETR
ncbi:hypothetical protein KJ068_11830 [bacterium]|nr:hypothetical protein [bacterium]